MERPRRVSLSLKVAAALKCPAASCECQLLRKIGKSFYVFIKFSVGELVRAEFG